jgi:hypothetical protein
MNGLLEHSAIRGPSDPIAIGSHLRDGEPWDPSPEVEPSVDINPSADSQFGLCRAGVDCTVHVSPFPVVCQYSVRARFQDRVRVPGTNALSCRPVNPSAVQTSSCRCGGRMEIGECGDYALGIVTTN